VSGETAIVWTKQHQARRGMGQAKVSVAAATVVLLVRLLLRRTRAASGILITLTHGFWSPSEEWSGQAKKQVSILVLPEISQRRRAIPR
jgi:hypothetical protein